MKKLILLCGWLILLSSNAYSADDDCYMQNQLQYIQCIESCDPGDFDCLDICYITHDNGVRDCVRKRKIRSKTIFKGILKNDKVSIRKNNE